METSEWIGLIETTTSGDATAAFGIPNNAVAESNPTARGIRTEVNMAKHSTKITVE